MSIAETFTELVRKKLPAGLQKKGIIDNIANIGSFKSFSLRMLGTPKYDKKTDKHVRIKKVIRSKDGSIFDFMICPPNDDSRVIDSPLLVVPESEVNRCSKENNDTNNIPDLFPLTRNSPSYCPICDQEHEKPGTRNPSVKLAPSETALS
ncbi:hypothetical protein C1645_839528 [Glomus cerebriforme]|uniref:Uncharacterized protein n=1 Tax=Glomus cerebriforme TaxID=658196 RepID=A0A397S5E8_9GLOM|nr:hypothetical protein C1645_839528 [Glomus cerebriforme]